MGVTTARTVRLLAAASAISAVFAMVGAPTAVADSTIECQGGQIMIDGNCSAPSSMDNTSDVMGLPDGSINDVVPSLNQGGSDLSNGGGIGGGGGVFGGGGGGHGR
jgi:hypothetical protein